MKHVWLSCREPKQLLHRVLAPRANSDPCLPVLFEHLRHRQTERAGLSSSSICDQGQKRILATSHKRDQRLDHAALILTPANLPTLRRERLRGQRARRALEALDEPGGKAAADILGRKRERREPVRVLVRERGRFGEQDNQRASSPDKTVALPERVRVE